VCVAEHRRVSLFAQVSTRLLIVIGAIIAAVLALYFGAVLAIGDGVRSGTTVQGIAIGGLSVPEATEKLEGTLGRRAERNLRVRALEQVFVVSPPEAGLVFDAEATVAQASGREWNPLRMLSDLTSERQIEPVVDIDRVALSEQVASMADTVAEAPVEPVLTMQGRTPVLIAGIPGRTIDEQATATLMEEAFLEPRSPIDAPVVPVPTQITPEQAAEAEAYAIRAVSAPVTVDASGTLATIPATAIADALSFTQEGTTWQPQLDGAILHASIRKQLSAVETPGRDATFRIKNGKPVVVKSKVGRGVEDGELSTQVLTVLGNQPSQRQVTVSVGVREPSLTTADAEALGVKEKISSFTQQFPYAAYRVQNIGQAAKYVNGTLLLPGETFSMNDTIKERTVANGYTVGYIIGSGGVFDEALGGGVSAATTAVWTGAFFAGMDRTSTRAHSIYISRYQPGLEATVAWGVFDMKFTNNTPYGVFITTGMTNTSMTVNFWSTKVYDKIAAEFGARKNIRPFQTIYDKSDKCSGQGGMDGFTIDVARVFYQGGKEVKREVISTNYRPSPKVVCGKKPKKDKKPAEVGADVTEASTASPKPKPSSSPKPAASPSTDSGNEFGPG
jgi:vancomycin resistance protein YoaR